MGEGQQNAQKIFQNEILVKGIERDNIGVGELYFSLSALVTPYGGFSVSEENHYNFRNCTLNQQLKQNQYAVWKFLLR